MILIIRRFSVISNQGCPAGPNPYSGYPVYGTGNLIVIQLLFRLFFYKFQYRRRKHQFRVVSNCSFAFSLDKSFINNLLFRFNSTANNVWSVRGIIRDIKLHKFDFLAMFILFAIQYLSDIHWFYIEMPGFSEYTNGLQ